MTSARIQPFGRQNNINIGCFNGSEITPINITQKNTSLFKYNNHFCLIWKSLDINFIKAIKVIKQNFRTVDNVMSDKHVKRFIKYEYKPKKIQSPLTNMVIYEIKTFNTIKCVPYANYIYKLSKLSGKYHRDRTEKEYQKCLNNFIVFRGLDNNNEMLDYVLQFKGEPKKGKNMFVEYNLYLIAHKGSGFDSYVVLNNLIQGRSVVNLIKNGAGIISLKIFNGYVNPKKIPQYVHFRCGSLHIKDSLKKDRQKL